ncbi:hypothetical protein [Sphaerisporangium aureirubrum]|uniref:RNHCP domain-containing protein n=1 Tax=Sphaerisporangium aureirubrum TaxID=1544736 RepID=A0ABW1NDH8_9ACTN
MSRRAAAVVDGQDALFGVPGDEPDPTPPVLPEPRTVQRAPRPRTHPSRPRRSKESQAEDCEPACLICKHPEGRGLCQPRCAVVCSHTANPDVVEVCIIARRVTARLVIGTPGSRPGRRLAVVTCPWCERVHWHAAEFGIRYRSGRCGWPYLVHLPRPADDPTVAAAAEHTEDHQHAAARGAAAARAALIPKDTP